MSRRAAIPRLRTGLLVAREKAVDLLTEVIEGISRRRNAPARLAAETLFAVYIATTLEWLMREGVPQQWLSQTMRTRLRLVWEGVA
ncbi:MAG TPA: hypothetical protein VMT20_19735 [Terriglobia bacterium]|nr:hypothetical protein [Terriglobia bacterium]